MLLYGGNSSTITNAKFKLSSRSDDIENEQCLGFSISPTSDFVFIKDESK